MPTIVYAYSATCVNRIKYCGQILSMPTADVRKGEDGRDEGAHGRRISQQIPRDHGQSPRTIDNALQIVDRLMSVLIRAHI